MNVETQTPNERYWLCPLYSFDSDCESIDLAEGIQIKPAPSKLREHIHKQTFGLYGLWEDPSEFDWAVFLPLPTFERRAATIENKRNIFEQNERARNMLTDLMLALKLCHKGSVIAGPLISSSVDNSEWRIGGTTIWTSVSGKNFILEDQKYCLSREDVAEVNNLLQDIRKWRNDGTLNKIDIALRRFHSSYHGPIEDRIIDQMIAFESLYIGDERGIRQKLASRTASLLRESKATKDNITDEMKDAYQKRCDIVHVIKEVPKEELRGVIPKTEEYLRLSLRKFLLLLSRGNSLKGIRNSL